MYRALFMRNVVGQVQQQTIWT